MRSSTGLVAWKIAITPLLLLTSTTLNAAAAADNAGHDVPSLLRALIAASPPAQLPDITQRPPPPQQPDDGSPPASLAVVWRRYPQLAARLRAMVGAAADEATAKSSGTRRWHAAAAAAGRSRPSGRGHTDAADSPTRPLSRQLGFFSPVRIHYVVVSCAIMLHAVHYVVVPSLQSYTPAVGCRTAVENHRRFDRGMVGQLDI